MQDGDQVGFTCEDTFCPVSYDQTSNHRTQFYKGGFNYPVLGSSYPFDILGFMSTWSIAVEMTGQSSSCQISEYCKELLKKFLLFFTNAGQIATMIEI